MATSNRQSVVTDNHHGGLCVRSREKVGGGKEKGGSWRGEEIQEARVGVSRARRTRMLCYAPQEHVKGVQRILEASVVVATRKSDAPLARDNGS